MQTVLLVMIFISVSGLVFGLGMWLSRDPVLNQRLGELGKHKETHDNIEGNSQGWRAKIAKVSRPMAWLSQPKEGWESSNFRVRFMRAGLRGPGWPILFFSAKTLLALVFPGLLLIYRSMLDGAFIETGAMFAALSLATLGYYLPNLVLLMTTRSRQREVEEALPDAVDLMRVCVEAGLGLDAAMNRAGEEMALRSQALSDEIKLVALDLRIGATRALALQNFALRTGVDDVATFVTILMQSEHFGTNVAESLRILSDTMREHRKVRAEERAAKIPLKLLFPLVFFIFPSLFLVLIGPAMIGIVRTLFPAMTGVR